MNSDNIKEALNKLGYKLVDCGNHWRTSALYRDGNNPTAVCVYKDTGTWIDFVKNSSPLPFRALISATIKSNDTKDVDNILNFEIDNSFKKNSNEKKSKHEKIYPESTLDKLIPHYSFYKKKGISEDILKDLKGGLATQGAMYQRFVFPIYDQNFMIHGFSGRDMTDSKPSKWKHIGSKTSWVYPYFVKSNNKSLTADSISQNQYVILVESIGDMLNLRQQNIYNALVTFGTSISSFLLCFLIGINPKKIIISFNNDSNSKTNRGEIGALKSYLKLSKHFDLSKLCISLPSQNDFGEMTADGIDSWLKNLPINNSIDIYDYHKKINSYISSGDITEKSVPKRFFSK